jgi:hypothetical protein
MNAAHLHLVISHAPSFGLVFGLLLWGCALVARKEDFRKAAFVLFVAAGLTAVPAYFTGQPARNAIANVPGVNLVAMDQHQEIAVVALVLTALTGVAALAALFAYQPPRKLPRWCALLTLLVGLLAGAAMVWTSTLGGQSRHTEISPTPR